MAGLNQFYYQMGFIALLVLILSPQAYCSARFLGHLRPETHLTVLPAALNLDIPEENNGVPSVRQSRHVFPCEMESGDKNIPVMREVAPPQKLVVAKYGRPLVFNLLPKGTQPPSAPSKGKNNLNN